MIFLKACPRCQGDMLKGSDIYGTYQKCVQCGYVIDLPRGDTGK